MTHRAFITTDLHLTDNPADEYRFEFMEKHILGLLKRKGKVDEKVLVILGDLTEEKDRHRARLVNRVCKVLHNIAKNYCPIVVLMGNHDYANQGQPFFEFLSAVPDVQFITEPTRGENLRSLVAAETLWDCLFLPHTRRHEEDWKPYNLAAFDAVFAHNTFDRAEGDSGRILEGIPLEVVKGAVVYSGDIHSPQKTGPVTYIGAPYTIDYGDSYKPRVLEYWLGHRPIWHDMSHLPQRRLIVVEPGKDLEDYKKQFHDGDMLKVRVEVDSLIGFDSIRSVADRHGKKFGVTLKVEPIVAKRAVKKSVKFRDTSLSDAELVRVFAERHDLDRDVEDMGLDIVEGVVG